MRRALLVSFFAMLTTDAVGQDLEAKDMQECLLENLVKLEPHHDNLLDLAEIVLETLCLDERQKFMTATGIAEYSGATEAFKNNIRPLARKLAIAARASRLGIELR